jgi:hypothetical protein
LDLDQIWTLTLRRIQYYRTDVSSCHRLLIVSSSSSSICHLTLRVYYDEQDRSCPILPQRDPHSRIRAFAYSKLGKSPTDKVSNLTTTRQRTMYTSMSPSSRLIVTSASSHSHVCVDFRAEYSKHVLAYYIPHSFSTSESRTKKDAKATRPTRLLLALCSANTLVSHVHCACFTSIRLAFKYLLLLHSLLSFLYSSSTFSTTTTATAHTAYLHSLHHLSTILRFAAGWHTAHTYYYLNLYNYCLSLHRITPSYHHPHITTSLQHSLTQTHLQHTLNTHYQQHVFHQEHPHRRFGHPLLYRCPHGNYLPSPNQQQIRSQRRLQPKDRLHNDRTPSG